MADEAKESTGGGPTTVGDLLDTVEYAEYLLRCVRGCLSTMDREQEVLCEEVRAARPEVQPQGIACWRRPEPR